MSEKKKQKYGWATAYFCTRSRYSKLYRDAGHLGAARGATIRPDRHAWPGATRPRYGLRHDRPACRGKQRARVRIALPWVSRDTNIVSWLGATVMSQYGAAGLRYNTATWQQSAATRPTIQPGVRATRRVLRTAGVGSRYSFCNVTGGSSRHDSMSARQGLRHRQYVLRHGQARPRHGACAATTRLRERRARGLFAQPGPWVCALCTRPSFDLVHCYESLFGSLFMNTVHEVFKNNNNIFLIK